MLEIPTMNVISGIVHFREIISESSQNVSETTPWTHSEKDRFTENARLSIISWYQWTGLVWREPN